MGFKKDVLARMATLKLEEESEVEKLKQNSETLLADMQKRLLDEMTLSDVRYGVKTVSYTDSTYFTDPILKIDLVHLYSICKDNYIAIEWSKQGDGVTIEFNLDLIAMKGKIGRYNRIFNAPTPSFLSWENGQVGLKYTMH